jgi:4-hydroxybenzoate polyprenyltransferase
MRESETPAATERLVGWLAAAHPFPVATVLAVTAALGLVSTGLRPPVGDFLLMLSAMLLAQLAIGWSNDYLDRERDAASRPEKPLVRGLMAPRTLAAAAWLAAAGALAAAAPLGLPALLLVAAGAASGFAYNLGLKGTVLSPVPYVTAFAVLPAFVWEALDVWRAAYAWLPILGAPLATAVHLANTLPDLADDAASDRGGVAVRLGRQWTLRLLGASLLLAAALAAAAGLVMGFRAVPMGAGFAGYAALTLAAALLYRQGGSDRPAFRLIAAAAGVIAAGWLAAV